MQPETDAVWTWEVTRIVGVENRDYVDDLFRMMTLQIVIQTMLHVTDPERFSYDADFGALLMFIFVAISAYWLVFRKLIKLV